MIKCNNNEKLWVEKFRPQKISDCILPPEMKSTLLAIIEKRDIPNLMLSGPAGTGKTTVAKAICEELELDYIVVNASLNGNIDTIRNEIQNFSSSVSMLNDGVKVVILDEADFLNQQSMQPALRGFIETFSKTTRFIFTCNYPNRIIDPIHSRTTKIDFRFSKKDQEKMMVGFFTRVLNILKHEEIDFDEAVVVSLITKKFPDFRKILNDLQRYSVGGKIDKGILANRMESSIADLVTVLKKKDYPGMREWVADNSDADMNVLWSSFYTRLHSHIVDSSKPD